MILNIMYRQHYKQEYACQVSTHTHLCTHKYAHTHTKFIHVHMQTKAEILKEICFLIQ